MLDDLVNFVNKYLVLLTNLVMPLAMIFMFIVLMRLESSFNSFVSTSTQIMQGVQTVDNQSLAQITTIGQLIQIMNAAAAGKYMNPSNGA